MHDTFSRQSILSGLKTLIWLVPMTALIWIYAERSQVVPAQDVTIPISFAASDPAHFHVEPHMAENDSSVIAQLLGPQGQLDEVRRLIAPQGGGPSVTLTIDTSQTGQRDVDMAHELSANPIFARHGVTVTSCKPATLHVSVDEIVETEADVQISPDQQNVVSGDFNPPKVKLSAPSQELENAKAQGPLVVYAVIDSNLLSQPIQRKDVTLHLQCAVKDAILLPDTVKANLNVHPANAEPGVILSVPVYELATQDVTNNYRISYEPTIANVHVLGPKDKIDALTSNEQKAIAILSVSIDDTFNGGGTRPLELKLPEGVSLDPKYPLRPFEFKLTKKSTE